MAVETSGLALATHSLLEFTILFSGVLKFLSVVRCLVNLAKTLVRASKNIDDIGAP